MAAVVAAVALFVSFSAAAGAQNRGGSVSGTVKDANGLSSARPFLSRVDQRVRPLTLTESSNLAT